MYCTIIICAMTGLVIVSCALAYPEAVSLKDNSMRYLVKTPCVLAGYKVFYTLIAFLGAVGSLSVVRDFANFSNGLFSGKITSK